jgi:stage III sporulation protein AA
VQFHFTIVINIVMEALFEILPEKLRKVLADLPFNNICELRLRTNAPVWVDFGGRNVVRTELVMSGIDLDNIIYKAAGYAIYSVNDQICRGYITIRGGIRIGIAGEVAADKGEISTIKNINALCIRVPHEVSGCSYPALPYIFGNVRPYKTLVIAPPGAGKTTFLRDLAVRACETYPNFNVLILDERGEIAANHLGNNQLFVGTGTDVITGGTKWFGFENGIRSLHPDVIITDEIAAAEDTEMIKTAARSGVVVFASVHAADIDEIRHKPTFRDLIADGVFERYVVLTVLNRAGIVAGVYDQNLKALSL